MTSATKARITRAQSEQLLAWMKKQQPQVYAGLVRRFTPASNVAGIFDSITGVIGKVADSVTNFFNSQGGQGVLTAAAPFLQTALEKKQLQLNLTRMQNGLPIQQYPVGQPGQPGYDPYGNNPAYYPTSSSSGVSVPWMWLGIGGLGLGLLLSRRRGR